VDVGLRACEQQIGVGCQLSRGIIRGAGVATVDDLVRLGREALAAAGWESARAFFGQAAEFGESAEILEWLWEVEIHGGRRGVHRFRLETPMGELGVLTDSQLVQPLGLLPHEQALGGPRGQLPLSGGSRRTRTASRTGSRETW
jgi:hypothetical protein